PFPLRRQQPRPGAWDDEHPAPTSGLDKSFAHQLVIALQDGEWVHPKLGGHAADGWQSVAFGQTSVKDHGHDEVPELAVKRLSVIPLSAQIHQVAFLHFYLRSTPL